MNLTLDANPAQLGIGRVNWFLSNLPVGAATYRVLRNSIEVYEGTRTNGTDGPIWPTYTYTWQAVALDAGGVQIGDPTAPQTVTVPWPDPEAGGPVVGLFIDFTDFDRSDHGYLEWNAVQALEAVQLSAAQMAAQSRDATAWDPVSVQYVMMVKTRAQYLGEDPIGWKEDVLRDAMALLPAVDWPHVHRIVMDLAPNGEGGAFIPGTVVGGRYGTAWLVGTPAANVPEIMHEVGGHCEGWGTHAGGSTQLTADWLTPNPSVFRGYADRYDWMGAGGGMRIFNGGERWRFGWLSQTTDMRWVTAAGDYELAPFDVSDGRPTMLAVALDALTIGIVEYVPETTLQFAPFDVVPAFQVRVLAGVKLDRNDQTGAPGGLVDTIAVLDNPLLLTVDVPWSNFGGGWVVTPLSFEGTTRGRVRVDAPGSPPGPVLTDPSLAPWRGPGTHRRRLSWRRR